MLSVSTRLSRLSRENSRSSLWWEREYVVRSTHLSLSLSLYTEGERALRVKSVVSVWKISVVYSMQLKLHQLWSNPWLSSIEMGWKPCSSSIDDGKHSFKSRKRKWRTLQPSEAENSCKWQFGRQYAATYHNRRQVNFQWSGAERRSNPKPKDWDQRAINGRIAIDRCAWKTDKKNMLQRKVLGKDKEFNTELMCMEEKLATQKMIQLNDH
jgi:hypothetical protein